MVKKCNKCGVDLILGLNWTEALRTHRKNRCRPCRNESNRVYNANWREHNREKAITDLRQWRLNNPEKYKAQLEREKAKRRERNT